MHTFYDTSPIAQTILNRLVDPTNGAVPSNTLRIGAMNSDFALSDQVNDVIGVNLSTISTLYQFDPTGTLVQMRPELALMHEVIHIIQNFADTTPSNPTDSDFNGATFDHLGPTALWTNNIAAQMPWADQHRVSYFATVGSAGTRYSLLTADHAAGYSFTDGHEVDIVRLGDALSTGTTNDMDHETFGDTENGMEMWYNFLDNGVVSNYSKELLVAWSSDMPGAFTVSYVNLDWSNYPAGPDVTGTTFYVAGFQPGDFGINAGDVPGFTAADARATMELLAGIFGGEDAGAALAIDHVWNLMGVDDYTPSPLRAPQGESMIAARSTGGHSGLIDDGIDLSALFETQTPLVYVAQGQGRAAPPQEASNPAPLDDEAVFTAFTHDFLPHMSETHGSDLWFA